MAFFDVDHAEMDIYARVRSAISDGSADEAANLMSTLDRPDRLHVLGQLGRDLDHALTHALALVLALAHDPDTDRAQARARAFDLTLDRARARALDPVLAHALASARALNLTSSTANLDPVLTRARDLDRTLDNVCNLDLDFARALGLDDIKRSVKVIVRVLSGLT